MHDPPHDCGSEWSRPTLVGELVTLRPIAARDTDAMWEMVHDSESNDLTATTDTFTYEQISEWCASRVAQGERLDLAIVENASGEFAGEAVLKNYNAEEESASFRIGLRGPAWFGRGLGGEATHLIVRHGLDVIGLRKITLEVLARNPRARRVYEKTGFRQTGEWTEDGEVWVRMEIGA